MNTKLITYDVIWIIIISLLASFLFDIDLDISQPINYLLLIKFIELCLLTITYGLFYHKYKMVYDKAIEADDLNFKKIESAIKNNSDIPKRIERKDYIKENFNYLNYFFLIASIILFIFFLFSKSLFLLLCN